MQQTSVLYDGRASATPSQREFAEKLRKSQDRIAYAAAKLQNRPSPTAPRLRPFMPLEFGKKRLHPESLDQWKGRQKAVPLPAVDQEEISKAIAQIDPRVTIVQELVADFYGITIHDIKGRHRMVGAMMPRHVAVWLAYNLVQRSFLKLALRFGGKDHATLINSVRRVDARRAADVEFQHELNELASVIRARIA